MFPNNEPTNMKSSHTSLQHVLQEKKCYRYSVNTNDLLLPFWKSYEQFQNQSQAEFEENQFFRILVFWSILSKYFLHWKWPPVSSTSIFSALTWPKIKSKDSFEKLTTSRFQNCPYFSKLTKIWWRYWQKTNWLFFGGSVWPQF